MPAGKPRVAVTGKPERGALLSSIEGFKAGALKKVATKDCSAPVVSRPPSNAGGGGSTGVAAGGGANAASPSRPGAFQRLLQ